MVPGMSCWESSEAGLEIAPTHSGVSIPAVAWTAVGYVRTLGQELCPSTPLQVLVFLELRPQLLTL